MSHIIIYRKNNIQKYKVAHLFIYSFTTITLRPRWYFDLIMYNYCYLFQKITKFIKPTNIFVGFLYLVFVYCFNIIIVNTDELPITYLIKKKLPFS